MRACLRRVFSTATSLSPKPSLSSSSSSIRITSDEKAAEDKIRSRLLYQCKTRGILETCILLGGFAETRLPAMAGEELGHMNAMLDRFEKFSDWDIFYWVSGEKQVPSDLLANPVFIQFKEYVHRNSK